MYMCTIGKVARQICYSLPILAIPFASSLYFFKSKIELKQICISCYRKKRKLIKQTNKKFTREKDFKKSY
jgi:hypothetical protein